MDGTNRRIARPMIGAIARADDTASEEGVLIDRCRAGDGTAYTALIERYQERVFNTCLRMCGRREDAEDFTQEAFIRALQSLDRFDGRARFYTWLFRIAVNVVLTARRKQMRSRTYSIDSGFTENGEKEQSGWTPASTETPPDGNLMADERQRLVLAALAELDDDHRCVLVLREMESLGYDEIAEILDLPAGTVKSRIHRARLALRDKLAPLMDMED